MYSNGIVKRIDNLGRVVLPKDVRKKLNLHENDEIEIILNNDEIILKKYSTLLDYKRECEMFASNLEKIIGEKIIFIDKDKVIVASGKMSSILDKNISSKLYELIEKREKVVDSNIEIVDNSSIYARIIIPLIVDSKVIGAILLCDTNINESKRKYEQVLEFTSLLITSKLEI